MPIEVRELVIRARIDDAQSTGQQSSMHTGANSARGLTERDIQRIVNQCVDKVIKVMNRRGER